MERLNVKEAKAVRPLKAGFESTHTDTAAYTPSHSARCRLKEQAQEGAGSSQSPHLQAQDSPKAPRCRAQGFHGDAHVQLGRASVKAIRRAALSRGPCPDDTVLLEASVVVVVAVGPSWMGPAR
ncbi:hypothetical protein SKAU_G00330170 [Synaphobranchus kaupii]|uniref:Uncharacterized protein n=1 Tax=Synaphobranchus kaupii TaxID=118154 RepID=A0A9Q1EQI7_SYNKA|nr:hypothetical protein SKAU_G00330170 [Synaphobranchus kaupii]